MPWKRCIDPRRTAGAGCRRFGLLLLLLVAVAVACGPRADGQDPPILLIGVDGLESQILDELILAGRLPTLEGLIAKGSYGRLTTLVPARSPVIWTSIATGKNPVKHGIVDFVKRADGSISGLFSNRDRRTKALFNIFSDYDRRAHSVGWWMTFPVEPIAGVMVAQTNTSDQVDTRRARAIWKGSLIPGVPGQVYPPERQAQVLALAQQVEDELPLLAERAFGTFDHPLEELEQRLWDNTQWAFRADNVYRRVTLSLLENEEPSDLLMVYFGGPDVVGHRFWRYRYPEQFEHPPGTEELANFGNIIGDYYGWIDETIGEILAAFPNPANVLVVSDHGMHGQLFEQAFSRGDPDDYLTSGEHQDGPPGVLIAAGPRIRSADRSTRGVDSDPPLLGTVYDIAPTVLALARLPVGTDMEGRVLRQLIDSEFLERNPVQTVATHDSPTWLAERARELDSALPEDSARERIEQLRALGYLE
jgi:hypothetical protein